METYLISMGINIILQMLKDKKAKVKFKSAFLKVRNSINAAFVGDKDFE